MQQRQQREFANDAVPAAATQFAVAALDRPV